MKNKTLGRRFRRQAMQNSGATFRDRVNEAVRTGRPVRAVNFVTPQQKPTLSPIHGGQDA